MAMWNENLSDLISNTITDYEMQNDFDEGYGIEEGKPFTAWSTNRVYFQYVMMVWNGLAAFIGILMEHQLNIKEGVK